MREGMLEEVVVVPKKKKKKNICIVWHARRREQQPTPTTRVHSNSEHARNEWNGICSLPICAFDVVNEHGLRYFATGT